MRETRGLTGTHLGCGEGGCGICTVVLVDPSGKTVPINSCLRRLCAVDGCHIVNTQGLGSVGGLAPGSERDRRRKLFAVQLLHARMGHEHVRATREQRLAQRGGDSQLEQAGTAAFQEYA